MCLCVCVCARKNVHACTCMHFVCPHISVCFVIFCSLNLKTVSTEEIGFLYPEVGFPDHCELPSCAKELPLKKVHT